MVVANALIAQGWTRTYGALSQDEGHAIRQVHDSGLVVVGSTGSFGFGNSDVYLLKVGLNGDLLWSKTFTDTQVESGLDVRQTLDSGLIITGFTNSFGNGGYDVYLLRTDSLGNVLWEKSYGGADWDFGYKVAVLPDGGFLVIGDTYSFGSGNSDVYLIRTDENGDTLWTQTYGGPLEDYGRSVKETSSGGFVLAGGYSHSTADMDAWLLLTDAMGDTVWTSTVGGDSLDYARDVVETADLGYSAIGITQSYSPYSEMLHLKVDQNGMESWQNNWGQINDQEGHELILRNDGGFIAGGYTKTSGAGGKEFFTQRVASNGAYESGRTNGYPDDEEGFGLDSTNDGRIVMVGYIEGVGFGQKDVMVILADSTGDTGGSPPISIIDPLNVNEQTEEIVDVSVYPNPFVQGTYIELGSGRGSLEWEISVNDITGRLVWIATGLRQDRVWFDGKALRPGVYMYRIETADGRASSGRLILQH